MQEYKTRKGISIYALLAFVVLGNGILYFLTFFLNSYIEVSLIKIFMVVFSVYCLIYVLRVVSLVYIIREDGFEISSLWGFNKILIPFNEVNGYNIQIGKINGLRLSGFGKTQYCFGRSVIENVGITHMFVTSNKQVIYIHTENMSYGISPEKVEEFEDFLIRKGYEKGDFKIKINRNRDLFKKRSFFIPFIIVTLIILLITLNPLILYLMNKLPSKMPLFFDATFKPIIFGTGKQFAFKQMTYGVLNMIILICMHYAAYFCAKYDKRSAYKYIYISLITAITFLLIQLRILNLYL
ncbi:membrane protein [Clostridium polyendosporum]|uniref:Membrane protein n=1 Tax=Clostridium polyendosporum TaxID=69208 RepID=A0A919RX96_9CLOT|nr:PH domain-containing protein [Clostridium polyendosporum]GIM28056.1 membrane protein [Clostridium polyendosporum]